MIEKEVIEKTPDKKPKNAFYERLDKARINEKYLLILFLINIK